MFDDLNDDQLLDALGEEWKKFTDRNDSTYGAMVDELIVRGVYPEHTVPANPNSILQMVDGYGARWHQWCRGQLDCPHCEVDLRDHQFGPPGLRVIGIYDRSRDRTTSWRCPDCGGEW